MFKLLGDWVQLTVDKKSRYKVVALGPTVPVDTIKVGDIVIINAKEADNRPNKGVFVHFCCIEAIVTGPDAA